MNDVRCVCHCNLLFLSFCRSDSNVPADVPKVEAEGDTEVGVAAEPSAGPSTSPGGDDNSDDETAIAKLLRRLDQKNKQLDRMEQAVAKMKWDADATAVKHLQLQLDTMCAVAQTYKADIFKQINIRATTKPKLRSKAADSIAKCHATYERRMHTLLCEISAAISSTAYGWRAEVSKIVRERNSSLLNLILEQDIVDQLAAKKAGSDSSTDSD